VLPGPGELAGHGSKLTIGILSSAVALGGLAVACGLFLGQRRLLNWFTGTAPARLLAAWWVQDWGFDWLYDRLLVRPCMGFARANIRDGIDLAILTIPAGLRALNGALVRTETGRIRWYAAGMAAGAVLVVAMVLV
jgi:NADH-quinone oxidoreductase subunit L